jgi:hypothetical protein
MLIAFSFFGQLKNTQHTAKTAQIEAPGVILSASEEAEMEVSNEAIRENFQSKVDTELLELAASSGGMTPDSKFLLLQELQIRLAKTKVAGNTVQLIHGWYTVTAPIAGIKFPECCPRCSRSGADTTLRFKSLEHRRFRLFYWKTEGAVLAVPHCSECAANLKRTRTICSWLGGLLALMWVVAFIQFRVPRFVIYIGGFITSLPIVYLYDRTSAVKLGEYGENVVEYRFRSQEYARAFATLNNVQSENAETLQGQLEEAIWSIQH